MREIRLYLPPPLESGVLVALPDATARHALSVLRLRAGALITAFDGHGAEFDAALESVSRRGASARIGEAREPLPESPLRLTLALGVSRGNRMDYALQKATELGVSRIAPVFMARSVVRLDEKRAEDRVAHWEQVVRSACEQCGRATLPEVLPARKLPVWLEHDQAEGHRLLLDPQATGALADITPTGAATMLIGPEGGLDPHEATAATNAGYTGIRLGPRVLRTETAAVVAVAALQLTWGDLAS